MEALVPLLLTCDGGRQHHQLPLRAQVSAGEDNCLHAPPMEPLHHSSCVLLVLNLLATQEPVGGALGHVGKERDAEVEYNMGRQ